MSERMDSRDVTTDVINMIILTQAVVGTLGNFSLLCHYTILYITGYRLRSTDLIIKHLIVANFLVLLCKGVPHTMAAFGWKQFPSDAECKLFMYLHRVGRGVSIASICLLSVFQVIVVNPTKSRWAELKVKAPRYIGPSISLCWILQMLVNINFLIFIRGKGSDKNITDYKDFGYYFSIRHDKTKDVLFAVLLSFPDVSCLGLMLWASGSMVFILHRHKKRVQHIHRTSTSTGSSPESKATKTILLLVSTFVYFYTLSSIFQVVLALLDNLSWFLVSGTASIAACFPTVSPFLLMSRDSSVHSLYFAWIRNAKSPTSMRNM
ncbi:vomeronasal type-1 receptor 4 [Camelus ferus]|uniref:Vomeronasal type-1 receptor n=2 Tax=Camelus TaxID=9836 RepID=S9WXS2_CAMFR|nr:vomeronasal type-1 receptor 4 [Camelus ferus]EPY80888.1 vomeronasal type-1 receptor 4 [Camelus ferus]